MATDVETVETEDKRRLVIVKMELDGFKSYGGVKVIGDFHTSFSAVVGPNGSGKSNVIDAMQFVFGKRASKMRLKSVSQLIHKSSTYPDLDHARVSVYFCDVYDKEDGTTEVVPDTELVISRVAYKNNTSKYFIDGKGSNYTAVTALLSERGVDLQNNRFLILQGEVEELSQKPPKARTPHEVGLLEYLEDVVGSNKFVEAIEDAEKTLETHTEAVTTQRKLTKAAEAERDSLETAKLEATAYLRVERKMLSSRWLLFCLMVEEEKSSVEDAGDAEKELQDEVDGIRAAIAEKKATVGKVQTRLKAAGKDITAAKSKDKKLRNTFAGLEKRDIKNREDLKYCLSQEKKHTSAKSREEKKAATAVDSRASLEASIPELEDALDVATAAQTKADAAVEKVHAAVMDQTSHLRDAVDAAQRDLEPWSETLSKATAQVDTLATETQLLEDRLRANETEVESLTKLREEVRQSAETQTKEVGELTAALEEKRAKLASGSEDLSAMEADETAAQDAAKAARAAAEERKQAHAASSSQSDVVRAIMDATKTRGPLAKAAVYGRLGSLGAIDKKYDTAVTTAAPSLNCMVVETTEDAQAVVAHVKRVGGRVRCIVLAEIRDEMEKRMAATVKLPAHTQRLFDLIDTEDKFRTAFYFAVRDTLVADNIDKASEAAFGKGGRSGKAMHRVVTLKGELIDTSGAMSGGGRPRSGGMGSSVCTGPAVSAEEVAAAEESFEEATTRFRAVKTRRVALAKELKALGSSIPKLEVALSKARMGVDSCAKRADELDARLAELETRSGPSEEDMAQLETMRADLKERRAEQASAAAKVDKLNAKVSALQKKVLDAGGAKLTKAKNAAEKAAEAVADADKALTKARVEIKATFKAEEKATKAAAKAAKDIEALKAKKDAIKADSAKIDDQAIELNDKIKEVELEMQAKTEEAADIEGQLKELSSEISKMEKRELDAVNSLEEARSGAAAAKAKITALEEKLRATKAEFDGTLFADEVAEEDAPKKQQQKKKKLSKAVSADDVDVEIDEDGEGGVEEVKSSESDDEEEEEEEEDADDDEEPELIRSLPETEDMDFTTVNRDDLKHEIKMLETQREELKRNVNIAAIAEYRKKHAAWLECQQALETEVASRDTARKAYDSLRNKRLDTFMKGYTAINMSLKEMYQMITLGGDADLELVDSMDPFSEGIRLSVRPPNKSWKNISNLSGGEKTLSSLALVFALHHFKPTPIYVMDEIDAALDFKNVSIIANYIKERTKNAQFIVISLRNNMFELADRLIGIYKTHDVTKSVAINPKEFSVPSDDGRTAKKKGKKASRGTSRPALADCSNVADSSIAE